jgi:CarD family transcriptional regulator
MVRKSRRPILLDFRTSKVRSYRGTMETGAFPLHSDEGVPRFDVGDLVVHPHHGVGRVISSQRRRLATGERSYLEIDLVDNTLTIKIPCESATAVGLRPVVGPPEVSRIVAVLEAEPGDLSGNWAAREKRYREQLKCGDVLELAAVVRDLGRRGGEAELASREKELRQRTRQRLASELGYALGLDGEKAVAYIDRHIARGPRTEPQTSATVTG